MSANGDNKAMITCPTCQQRFSVPVPRLRVLNDMGVSMAIATHEKPIRCVNGHYMVWLIQSAQAVWVTQPITDEQASFLGESRIVVPEPHLKQM